MILDMVAPGVVFRPILWLVISICLWCISLSRKKKYKKMIEDKNKEKIKKQSRIFAILAAIFAVITIYDLFFAPTPSGGPISTDWEYISTEE